VEWQPLFLVEVHVRLISFAAIQIGMTFLAAINAYSQCAVTTQSIQSSAEVTLVAISSTGSAIRMKATVQNPGATSLLIATAPKRSNGSTGPYFELQDSKILLVSYRLFELPQYDLYANHVGVEFSRIQPRSELVQEFELRFPIQETIPPYHDLRNQRYVQRQEVKAVNIVFGVLPDDEGIRAVLSKKYLPYWTAGQDVIRDGRYRGKTLWETQSCLKSAEASLER
jgi:hypothetical protein